MKSMAMAACVGTVLLTGGQVAAEWEERLGAAGSVRQRLGIEKLHHNEIKFVIDVESIVDACFLAHPTFAKR